VKSLFGDGVAGSSRTTVEMCLGVYLHVTIDKNHQVVGMRALHARKQLQK